MDNSEESVWIIAYNSRYKIGRRTQLKWLLASYLLTRLSITGNMQLYMIVEMVAIGEYIHMMGMCWAEVLLNVGTTRSMTIIKPNS